MGKYIAVDGCVLLNTPTTGTGTININTLSSTKVKIDGKGVYAGPLAISISAYTSAVITVPGSGMGNGVLNPTATKVKAEGKPVVLEGDSVTIVVTGQAVSGTTTVPAVENVTVKIQSAGQIKVKGE